MPKIIPELRERLIAAAKRRLLSSETHDAAIRDVALDCNTAVGTVYNYFKSKDELLAAVMLEDWLAALERINAAAETSNSLEEALRAFDAELRCFVETYRPTWRSYTGGYGIIGEHHPQLVSQLKSLVTTAAKRHGRVFTSAELTVASEMLLVLSQRSREDFEMALPVIMKII